MMHDIIQYILQYIIHDICVLADVLVTTDELSAERDAEGGRYTLHFIL